MEHRNKVRGNIKGPDFIKLSEHLNNVRFAFVFDLMYLNMFFYDKQFSKINKE
tara:strand:+ start:145 stop:303 length:159 start_codon:yes stop_codon:yes gene_type:complete